MHLVGEA